MLLSPVLPPANPLIRGASMLNKMTPANDLNLAVPFELAQRAGDLGRVHVEDGGKFSCSGSASFTKRRQDQVGEHALLCSPPRSRLFRRETNLNVQASGCDRARRAASLSKAMFQPEAPGESAGTPTWVITILVRPPRSSSSMTTSVVM